MQTPNATPEALRAIGLSKRFDGQQVLRQLDFDLQVGQSLAIMGNNGAGKTTLLRCLAGVVRPDAGQLWWQGEPWRRGTRIASIVGMVAHESQLYPNLTIYENLLFAARMSAVAHARRQVEQWLERVGLTPYAQCLPCQISHGMRRRVSVARGVLHQPSVVLLDEPFSGLDSEGQDWLAELLADLQRTNQSICFTTHDTNHAQLCADQVFVLQSGKLQPVSDVPNLTNKHSLSHQPAA